MEVSSWENHLFLWAIYTIAMFNNQMVHQTCWEDEYFFFKDDSARFIEFTVITNEAMISQYTLQ